MQQKRIFALAGVFLAVAIVVPVVVLTLQATNLIIPQNPSGMETGDELPETGGGLPSVPPKQVPPNNNTTLLLIVLVVGVVFVSLFVVTIYYGIKHVQPTPNSDV
ncbi:MAG: hypothetical protein LBI79_02895 [Nitrososphaerota archaeon]|jgi:hypothetical protein|nr:hypothetical protein [Nitrososphaerota archaeon]